MVTQTNYLYYNTPDHEFKRHYAYASQALIKEISTQLPKPVALIRTVALAAFSVLLIATKSAVWVWPVAIAGLAFAGWTVYSHLLEQDRLVTLFNQIARNHTLGIMKSSNDAFDELPKFGLNGKVSLADSIHMIDWDKLNYPVLRAATEDGRKILIVRALSRHPRISTSKQDKTIFAYVEKLTSRDQSLSGSSQSYAWYLRLFLTALTPFDFVSDFSIREKSGMNGENRIHIITSTMSPKEANEFLAQ